MTLYQITLKNIVAGVEVSPDGIVTEAAPVFRKFVGAQFVKLCAWVKRNDGDVELVREGKADAQVRYL